MGIAIQIVDSREADHSDLIAFLKSSGYQVLLSTSGKRALKKIKEEKPTLVFLALDLPDLGGIEILRKIKKIGRGIILFTMVNSAEQGIEAMKLGAEHYFFKPYNLEEVKIVLKKYLAIKYYRERVDGLRLQQLDKLEKSEMVVVSKSMKEICQHTIKIAEDVNTPVLIEGEVGTGKELLAKILHLRSHHFMFPFTSMNCKDRSLQLLDVQLLGMHKVTDGHKGRIEEPHMLEGGTFFLYNIEHLTKANQTKVLKFLKSKRREKGKKTSSYTTGRRIIATANVNLKTLVDKGKFNKELYQKISRCSIYISPLRKRTKEIIPLAMHFIKSFNSEYGKQVAKIAPDVRSYLESYDWPGNVNELRNVIEHAVILSQSESLSMKEIEFKASRKLMTLDSLLMNGSFLSLDEMVTLYVNTVIKKVKGNKSKAAKILRVSRNTLKKKSIAI